MLSAVKIPSFQSVAVTEPASEAVRWCADTNGDIEMNVSRSTPSRYSPVHPDNTPAILTFSNVSVTTKTNPPKVLLNNVHGSITGGFWAIMGEFVFPNGTPLKYLIVF